VSDEIWAVIVTYNRRALLEECLKSVLAQTRPPDRILVVDNASTDGTDTMLAERFPEVTALRLAENEGVAGGIHEGVKIGYESGADWFFLLDDDTIPTPTALEYLLEPLGRLGALPEPVMLCSKVLWTDGSIHQMNTPWPRWDPESLAIAACERELLPLRAASYPSLLLHRRAVERHGLPVKEMFIWGDDIEYTARILRHEAGYLAPRSISHHKTATNYHPATTTSVRFYYDVRNKLWMIRGDAWGRTDKFWLAVLTLHTTSQYLALNRFRPPNVGAVLRGLRDGLFRSADEASPGAG